MKALSGLISDAMGKPVVQEAGTNEPEIETDDAGEDAEAELLALEADE